MLVNIKHTEAMEQLNPHKVSGIETTNSPVAIVYWISQSLPSKEEEDDDKGTGSNLPKETQTLTSIGYIPKHPLQYNASIV